MIKFEIDDIKSQSTLIIYAIHNQFSNFIMILSNQSTKGWLQSFLVNKCQSIYLLTNPFIILIITKMLFQLFLSLSIALFILILNYCWIRPRKQMKFYQKQLIQMKYVTKIIPYKLFYNRILAPLLEGKRQGDPSLYFKTQFFKYDIILSNVMNTPCIELGHIDFIKDYHSMDKHFDYPKLSMIIDPVVKLLGHSLFLSQGKLWKQKRIILNKIFNFEFIKMQTSNIVDCCDRSLRQVQQKYKKQGEGQQYVQCYLLNDFFKKIFSSVIISGFLGIRERQYLDGIEITEYLCHLIDDIGQHRLISSLVVLGNRFFDLQVRRIDKSINQRKKKVIEWGNRKLREQLVKIQAEMKENRNQIVINNIFKAFVVYKNQNNISDDQISNKDIFAEFLGFIFAGTDTTSNFLNVMLCYIAKNPEIQAELRKQIEENMQDDDYSYQNLKKFKYIEALQKQTTRIYGPLNMLPPRKALNDNYLNGLAIKKGTLIIVNHHGNHYSQKYFKQPLKFRPERWLNGECNNIDPFVLIGFSAGARTCIGKHLALLQSKIVLIKLMKRFKKITLGIQNFKWDKKLFTMPQYFLTKLTIKDKIAENEMV